MRLFFSIVYVGCAHICDHKFIDGLYCALHNTVEIGVFCLPGLFCLLASPCFFRTQFIYMFFFNTYEFCFCVSFFFATFTMQICVFLVCFPSGYFAPFIRFSIMSNQKQIRLSFGQKRQIVCLLDDGVSHSNIAKQFGVKRQAIGYIAKDPDKFKDALDSGKVTSSGKSLKQSQTHQEADTMLLQWFLNMRNQNKVINGHLLVASFKRILERQGHD